MRTNTLNCPRCGTDIDMVEAITKPILVAAREEYGVELSKLRRRLIERERVFATLERGFGFEKAAICADVNERVAVERRRIMEEERTRSREIIRRLEGQIEALKREAGVRRPPRQDERRHSGGCSPQEVEAPELTLIGYDADEGEEVG